MGNLDPRPEAICSWTLRMHIVNGVPLSALLRFRAELLTSQQNMLVGVDTVGELSWQ